MVYLLVIDLPGGNIVLPGRNFGFTGGNIISLPGGNINGLPGRNIP